MEDGKYLQKLLESSGKYGIQRYKVPEFKKTHESFAGTPRKHPTDKAKVLLLADPFGTGSVMYEFSLSSIEYIEEVETITNAEGKSAPVVRIWVRRGEIGHRIEPFFV